LDSVVGFKLLRQEEVPLLQATFYESEHIETGAKWIHFACADENNQFAAIIPAVPSDETGAPHILEHCVLTGGSKRYPDAKSRGALRVGGVAAWTGWEYTWYFFGGKNHQDFLKRIDTDLDYLFEPLLQEETFWWQAHHLEFEDPQDPSTQLVIRGVIFNEQKGIFSLPLYVSWTEICRALLPGTPYALEHGGTSRTVPDLTWQGLKDFHARHYHPSNAHLLTWGDVPHEDVQAVLDDSLSRAPERPFERTIIPPIERFDSPRRHDAHLPISAGEDPAGKGMVLMGWVTAPATDPYEFLLYDLVADLLMGSPSAPLRHALASSGFGRSIAETFDRYGVRYRDLVLSLGLQDTDTSNADKIESLILDTLRKVVSDGVDSDVVDAAIHRLEFGRRTLRSSQGGEGSPTSLFIEFLNTPWINGGDPLPSVNLEADLARLDAKRKEGRPIEDWIQKWLIDNPHRSLVVLEADPGADVRLEDEERKRLADLKSRLDDAEKHQIVENAGRLQAFQEKRTVPPPVPDVQTIADEPTPAIPEALASIAGGVSVEAFPVRTNGITYLDFFVDVGGLPEELWDYLQLYALALIESAGKSSVLGDLSADVMVPVDGSGDRHRRYMRLGGRALERNQGELVTTLAALLKKEAFETDVVRRVINNALGPAEQGVFTDARGTGYIRRLAGSHVRESWSRLERIQGFAQLKRLRRLRSASDKEITGVVDKIASINEQIARRGLLEVFAAVSGEGVIRDLNGSLEDALSSLPEGGNAPGFFEDRLGPDAVIHEARTFGLPSAFNCEVIAIPGQDHPDTVAVLAAGSLMGRVNAMEVARKGTAYHAGCDPYSTGGSLTHWSGRDPNVARTFRAFAEGARRLREGEIKQDEFEVARFEISVIADLSETPPARARRVFLESRLDIDPTRHARFRKELASLTPDDVSRVAQQHLSSGGARATIASRESVEAARREGIEFQAVEGLSGGNE
jgi:Zn-dependent M16 (insulinase) family peptidase